MRGRVNVLDVATCQGEGQRRGRVSRALWGSLWPRTAYLPCHGPGQWGVWWERAVKPLPHGSVTRQRRETNGKSAAR